MVSSGGEEEKMDKKIDVRGNDKTMNHKAGVRLQRTCIRISTVQFAKQPGVTSGQLIYLPLSFKGIVQPKCSCYHLLTLMLFQTFLCSVKHKKKRKKRAVFCAVMFSYRRWGICCVLGQWREWKHVWMFCGTAEDGFPVRTFCFAQP